MAEKPSYKLARDERKGEGSMTIEGAVDKTEPTFTDKNLDLGYGVGGANNVTTQDAKPGGSISSESNAARPKPTQNLTKT